MVASRQGIHQVLKSYVLTGSIGRKESSGRRSKVTEAILKVLVKNLMREDDETSVLVAFFLNSEKRARERSRNVFANAGIRANCTC